MIKCAMCESEASVFFCYPEYASEWRRSLTVHTRCAYCFSTYPVVTLHWCDIHHITKEDYLAALAMAEL